MAKKVQVNDEDLEKMISDSTDPFESEAPPAKIEEEDLVVDFEEVSDVKNGYHPGIVQEAQRGTSGTGNPKLTLKIELPMLGRSVTFDLSLLKSANFKKFATLRALGIQPGQNRQEGDTETTSRFPPSALVGRPCLVLIQNEMYQPEADASGFAPPARNIPKVQGLEAPDERCLNVLREFGRI